MYENIYCDNLYNNNLLWNLFCGWMGYQISILLQHIICFHSFIGN